MMARKRVLVTILCLLPLVAVLDNPIMSPYINEFMIATGGDWSLEMLVWSPQSLNGWGLTSKSDTAYFKTGMTVGPGYVLLSQAEMQQPILFSRISNTISLISPQGLRARLSYGSISGSMIAYPAFGQSISYSPEGFFYLDNTATLGQPNDTTNAMGDCSGLVTDSLGTPLVGATVVYHDWNGRTVFTDSTGNFHFRDYAKAQAIWISCPGYASQQIEFQMRPDSGLFITAHLCLLVSSVDRDISLPGTPRLLPNFPNPFNPVTTISYILSRRSLVMLRVYAMNGQTVAALVNDVQRAGDHHVRFDGTGLASGIYFCRLQTEDLSASPGGATVRTMKMVLIR
jgi:hypothetical protein